MPGKYPSFTLWETDIPEGSRLKVINQDDFPQTDILEGLGIDDHSLVDSFGITDETEIRRRQALMRFLHDHPNFRRWALANSVRFSLPESGQDFITFHDPLQEHNPYWSAVRSFIQAIDGARDVPPGLRQLADGLRRGLVLEQSEREMAEVIIKRLQAVTALEGIASFRIRSDQVPDDLTNPKSPTHRQFSGLAFEGGTMYGHRLYSQSLSEVRRINYPAWTKNRWHPKVWLGFGWRKRRQIDRENQRRRAAAYQGMVVQDFHPAATDDLTKALTAHLTSLDAKLLEQIGEVTITFRYTRDGLEYQIIRLHAMTATGLSQASVILNWEGFTPALRRQIEEQYAQYVGIFRRCREAMADGTLMNAAVQAYPDLLGRRTSVPSPRMDEYYRWYAVLNLYHSSEFRDVYHQLQAHRAFFRSHCQRLNVVADLLEKLIQKAGEYGAPLCFPEVKPDGHVVAFDELYPIQLLMRLKRGEVVPVRCLPELNGQMIGLTGAHGGGKTETGLTIPVNLWLAQSGLPVFGRRFTFNVKQVLGLVFIAQRGVGSTCEQLVGKISNVLRGIKGIDGHRVVLVLDEVGTGTQERSGFELGRDLLKTLAGSGVSVLFSTQITSLAEFSQGQLGAQCFQFDRQHRISAGIGDGGMNDLRRESGLDKLLVRS